MKGLEWNNPWRIRTPDELINYINEVGFLPLFANEVEGFSAEDHVSPDFWWTGDPEQDPWEWRQLIARSGRVYYGRFFDGKCGYISREWFPVFACYRRGGRTFDELWTDAEVNQRCKKIMTLFGEDTEMNSMEIRRTAGFGKDGEKGFEGTLSHLQELCLLTVCDFRQKIRKDGVPYGWHVSVYSQPKVPAAEMDPAKAEDQIRQRVRELFGSDGGLLIGKPYREPKRKKLQLYTPDF